MSWCKGVGVHTGTSSVKRNGGAAQSRGRKVCVGGAGACSGWGEDTVGQVMMLGAGPGSGQDNYRYNMEIQGDTYIQLLEGVLRESQDLTCSATF